MIFIESSIFTKLMTSYLSDSQYSEFQKYLLKSPDSGDLIRGSGGLRKVRWISGNKGKRGGVRIIYFWKMAKDQIYLLTIYAKNEITDLSPNDKHALKQMIDRWHDG